MALCLERVLEVDDALGERAVFGNKTRAFIFEGANLNLLLRVDPDNRQKCAMKTRSWRSYLASSRFVLMNLRLMASSCSELGGGGGATGGSFKRAIRCDRMCGDVL